jgi:hypothetical protein
LAKQSLQESDGKDDSRGILSSFPDCLKTEEVFSLERRLTLELLAYFCPEHRHTRCLVQVKIACATPAKPDKDMGSIRPEEGADLAGHLHCRFVIKALEGLDVDCSVIKIAFRTVVSVKALSFSIHIPILIHFLYSLAPHHARIPSLNRRGYYLDRVFALK